MSRITLIAEAGVNHNADMDMAKWMIAAAANAGADYVKFQTAVPELVYTKNAPKADYQKKSTGAEGTQLEMAKKIHLPVTAYAELKEYATSKNIIFMSTPFDLKSVEVLEALNEDYYKIPSGEITNLPYLRKIGRLGRKVIMSVGMANLGEVEAAINALVEAGTDREKITLLHCNTDYPTAFTDVNLSAMVTLRDAFKMNVGYSDHTLGIEVSVAAAALGATIIEKHFTLDKNLPGPDHKASLDPGELKDWVRAIRNVEEAIGDGIKKASPSEEKNKKVMRKGIVASRPIKAGELFSEKNLTVKRPEQGLSPMLWDMVIGKKAPKAYGEDEFIDL